ncbi:MAG: hypothetical protein WAS23_12925 [Dokdonella sp.]|uniref:beta strand repeat-containing protein n=1 Tax=Dokdonella sp. TaxID=2291710 RepID=UPI003BB20A94
MLARIATRKGLSALVLLFTMTLLAPLAVAQQVCGLPGNDPASTASGIVNSYFDGSNQASLGSAATSLTLGAVRAGSATTTIASGDLLIVMQMQDGVIDGSNSANYGSGTGVGKGTTSVGNAGLYEFVRATAAGGAGASITFTPALTNSYTQAAATATLGQRRYQVIRVPQYAAVTLQGVTAPAWNGLAGGVVAIDSSQILTLGGATVEGQTNRAIFLGGKGFRGAVGYGSTANSPDTDWRLSDATSHAHGGKAEGIAGTPRYVALKNNGWGFKTTGIVTDATLVRVDNGVNGYPNGDRARGAPGNAGGGGTDGGSNNNQYNAGGGGGSNYAEGGRGGRPFNRPLNDTNGRGGAAYAGVLNFQRVFLGGGGGAGGTNNSKPENAAYENQAIACNIPDSGDGDTISAKCSSGAAGGGIAILRAKSVTGSGVIDVRGAHGYNVGNDAGGGGGAAGAAVLHVIEGGNASVIASGGDGGNAWASRNLATTCGDGIGGAAVSCRHGPGGGGSGGFIAFSPAALSITADLSGGAPGRTTNGASDTYEANGFNGGLSTFLTPSVPGVIPGALCFPDLRLSKTNGIDVLLTSGTTTYALTVSNAGAVATAGAITLVDVLPVQLSVADGPLALSGAQSADWTCNAASNVITCSSSVVIGASSSSTFAFTANVSAANGDAIVNLARVGGGGDPDNETPTPANTAACTDNHVPLGCAIDADVTNAPFLALAKSGSAFIAGNAGSYTLTVANLGSQPSSGTIRVVDVLPAFVSFTGFTSPSGFACVSTPPNVVCTSTTAIPVGGTATITIDVAVANGASSAVTNRARVGGGGDPVKPGLPPTDGSTASICPAPIPPATSVSNALTGCAAVTDPVRRVDLSLAKTDGQNFMPVNGQTAYQFTVSNNGDAASIGTIFFADELPAPMTWPAALTIGGANGANWACVRVDADTVTCSSSVSIPAGGSSTFSLIANVGAVLTNGTLYTNKARIAAGGDPDLLGTAPTPAQVIACTGNNVAPGCALDINVGQSAAQIRLTKSHPDPQAHNPGDTFAVNLVVTNSGAATTTANIVVVDVLPVGLTYSGGATFTSDGFNCAFTAAPAPGFITCTRTGTMVAGNTRTITFNVTVNTPASNTIVNRAEAGGGGDPQNGTPPTATTAAQCNGSASPSLGCAVDLVPLNADLGISKLQCQGGACGTAIGNYSASMASVLTGTQVRFFLRISNAGPSRVVNALISDSVPSNFTALSVIAVTPSGGATCSPADVSLSGNSLSGTIPSLPSGSTCDIVISGTATTVGNAIPNTATVTAPVGIVDTAPSNNSSTVTTTIVAPVPQLTITKVASASPWTVGIAASYTLSVQNTGTAATVAVATISDPIPAGLTIGVLPAGCTAAGQIVTCSIPAGLAPTATASFVIPVTPTNAAEPSVTNTATVSGGGDPTCDPIAAAHCSDSEGPTPVNAPVLSTTKVGVLDNTVVAPNDQSNVGDTIAYTITVVNSGNGSATGVSVSDPLVGALSCTIGGTGVTLPTPLAAGASLVCTGTYTLVSSDITTGSVANTATTSGTNVCNPTTAGSTCSGGTTTPLDRVPVLTIAKSATPTAFTVGQPASYTITVTNSGTAATVGDIVINDTLPSGISLISAAGTSWSCTGTTVLVCTFSGSLAPGEAAVLTLNVDVAASAIHADNTAVVSGGGDPGCPAAPRCSGTVIVPVGQLPDLTIVKAHVGNFAQGQVGAMYTLIVSNVGGGATSGMVSVTDVPPGDLTPTAIAGAGWSCTLATLTCTRLDVLNPGASYPPITLTVDVSLNAASPLVNEVTVIGGGDDTPFNNEDSDSVVLGGPPVTGIVAVDVDANWALLLLVTTILLLAAPKARRRYL